MNEAEKALKCRNELQEIAQRRIDKSKEYEKAILKYVESIIDLVSIKTDRHRLHIYFEWEGFRFDFEKHQVQNHNCSIRMFRLIYVKNGAKMHDFLEYNDLVNYVFDYHSKALSQEDQYEKFAKLIGFVNE